MNDRYLFKAKSVDNGEWIEGSIIQCGNRCWISPAETDTRSLRAITNYFADWRSYEADTDTICQCTGLKDKNGKLIYENDILSGYIDDDFPEDETRERVLWHENGWRTKELGSIDYEELDDFALENFEVIDNGFDNPELLESECVI